jgi:RimJ/RimL family protein N-acetyltransferase
MEPGIYPEEYIEELELKDGSKVILRPIRPDDAPRLQQLYKMLSPETIYMRFLVVGKELSDKQAREFACVDYINRMALVATIQEDGEERVIGVARYGMLSRPEPGLVETAIVVRDDHQRRGLGKLSMIKLMRYARDHGVKAFVATVHTNNFVVMNFIKHSGYPYDKVMIEPGIWEIRIDLPDEIYPDLHGYD